MKVPTFEEVEKKKKKDRNPLDKFVFEWPVISRKSYNALQKLIDYVESQRS